MPFLTSEWLRYMCRRAPSQAKPKSSCQNRTTGSSRCARAGERARRRTLTRAFESGVRRVTEAMKQLSMEVLDAADWKRFDNFDRLFWNMNTPADYDEAIRMLKAERP